MYPERNNGSAYKLPRKKSSIINILYEISQGGGGQYRWLRVDRDDEGKGNLWIHRGLHRDHYSSTYSLEAGRDRDEQTPVPSVGDGKDINSFLHPGPKDILSMRMRRRIPPTQAHPSDNMHSKLSARVSPMNNFARSKRAQARTHPILEYYTSIIILYYVQEAVLFCVRVCV